MSEIGFRFRDGNDNVCSIFIGSQNPRWLWWDFSSFFVAQSCLVPVSVFMKKKQDLLILKWHQPGFDGVDLFDEKNKNNFIMIWVDQYVFQSDLFLIIHSRNPFVFYWIRFHSICVEIFFFLRNDRSLLWNILSQRIFFSSPHLDLMLNPSIVDWMFFFGGVKRIKNGVEP